MRLRARTMKEQSIEEVSDLESAAIAASETAAMPVQIAPSNATADTLVIYTYSKSDPEYERNLEFFIKHGMWENDNCHYLIIVQQVP